MATDAIPLIVLAGSDRRRVATARPEDAGYSCACNSVEISMRMWSEVSGAP